MKHDLEEKLRKSLRPVDPAPMFAERVMKRLQAQRTVSESKSSRVSPSGPERTDRRSGRWIWAPAALAATLVAAILVRHELHLRRELAQGRVAREQLLEALRLTSEKLDVAYRAVRGGAEPALIVLPANPAVERERASEAIL